MPNALAIFKSWSGLGLRIPYSYFFIVAEFMPDKASISQWCRDFSKECQEKALENPDAPNEMELMQENLRLRKELAEANKENLFLNRAAAFFAKEID